MDDSMNIKQYILFHCRRSQSQLQTIRREKEKTKKHTKKWKASRVVFTNFDHRSVSIISWFLLQKLKVKNPKCSIRNTSIWTLIRQAIAHIGLGGWCRLGTFRTVIKSARKRVFFCVENGL